MGSDNIAIVMVMGTLGVCVVTIVRTAVDHIRRTRSERTQAEMFNTLMNKLGNGTEVLGYLETEAGKGLLKSPPEMRPSPYARILNSVQLGVVLTILGIGILSLNAMLGGDRDALIVGTLILTVGIGMLSAAAASWVLSKKLGLMDTGRER